MKTPKEWLEDLEYVESQEHPSDKAAAWETFITAVQMDARQDQMKKYRDLKDEYNDLQREFDGLRHSF
jgi:hypothetical protein